MDSLWNFITYLWFMVSYCFWDTTGGLWSILDLISKILLVIGSVRLIPRTIPWIRNCLVIGSSLMLVAGTITSPVVFWLAASLTQSSNIQFDRVMQWTIAYKVAALTFGIGFLGLARRLRQRLEPRS